MTNMTDPGDAYEAAVRELDATPTPDELKSEYERFVRPIEQKMMRAVWRIVRDPDEADDAFGEALETVWKRWDRVRRHPNPPALIMTICVHAAYDRLRKSARLARHETIDDRINDHPSRQPSVDDQAAAGQIRGMIYRAMRALPPMQRSTVALRLLADLSYDAIAQALGCSESTARTHGMRALARLRQQLAPLRPDTREEIKP